MVQREFWVFTRATMAQLKINRDVLEKARERSVLTEPERSRIESLLKHEGKGAIPTPVSELPVPLLRALLDDTRLSANQRAVICMHLFGMTGRTESWDLVYDTQVSSATEFGSTFVALGQKSANCEMFLNGRWYPVIVVVEFIKDTGHTSKGVLLKARLSLCEITHFVMHYVYPEIFLDEAGVRRDRTVIEVLAHFGFRRMQARPGEFNLKLLRAERASREVGQLVLVRGPVLRASKFLWMRQLESQAMGRPEMPRKAVVDPELEVCEEERSYYGMQSPEPPSRLPFVRIFSMDAKSYVYADVDDVVPYAFDTAALSRLHLPRAMLAVLDRVFRTPLEEMFGDIIQGKHGGLVVLASGKPGVGKTLTAEVYAETTERPLYVLELGELGTDVAQVEENLNRVFSRVARWNAVLQFDECEIFLTERGEDLERSAIVGIFLRLLDYYRGILFLTTNRAEVLDHAVLSRVMLRLDYPDLDRPARANIWRTMFESAGLTLLDGSLEELAEKEINGRQIRNLSRLAKVLHPAGRVTLAEMREVLRYGCN
jgi:hypothetical protein